MKTVNYDQVAEGYDKRYETAYLWNGIASKLLDLIRMTKARRVLEAGCGTGHWLELLRGYTRVVGMDLSLRMLQKAAESCPELDLICGDVAGLPFSTSTFDMIICVNAIHHFRNAAAFVVEARRLLTPNGILVVIGMNPHTGGDRWFIYEYFPGTRKLDLQRYPSPGTITDWMISAGFKHTHWQLAELIRADRNIDNVLPLSKDFTSQLSLLSLEDYEQGVRRIEAVVHRTKKTGEIVVFPVEISLSMITGWNQDQAI